MGATDEVTKTKVCNEGDNPWVLVDVKDNDEAGITMESSLFILNANEEAWVLGIRLQTRPERNVEIEVLLRRLPLNLGTFALKLYADPTTFVNNKTYDINFRVKPSASGSESQITFLATSEDPVYNGRRKIIV